MNSQHRGNREQTIRRVVVLPAQTLFEWRIGADVDQDDRVSARAGFSAHPEPTKVHLHGFQAPPCKHLAKTVFCRYWAVSSVAFSVTRSLPSCSQDQVCSAPTGTATEVDDEYHPRILRDVKRVSLAVLLAPPCDSPRNRVVRHTDLLVHPTSANLARSPRVGDSAGPDTPTRGRETGLVMPGTAPSFLWLLPPWSGGSGRCSKTSGPLVRKSNRVSLQRRVMCCSTPLREEGRRGGGDHGPATRAAA